MLIPVFRGRARWIAAIGLVLLSFVSGAADSPIITYQEIIAEFADANPVPLLSVYANGRTVVHLAAYRRHSGTFETRLDARELAALVRQLRQAQLTTFDPAKTRAIRNQRAIAKRSELYNISDDSLTVIKLNLPAERDYRIAARPATPAPRAFRWTNLQAEAARFNEPALVAAAAIERRLKGLVAEIAGAGPAPPEAR